MYTIKVSKQILKFLDAHPFLRKPLKNRVEYLKYNPRDVRLDIKALEGLPNHFRMRMGKYRIVYKIIEDTVEVLLIKLGSRGDVYKSI